MDIISLKTCKIAKQQLTTMNKQPSNHLIQCIYSWPVYPYRKISLKLKKLQADLEAVLLQLETLWEEVENGSQSKLSSTPKDQEENPESKQPVTTFTLIGNLCNKCQVPLASVIAHQDHFVEGGKLISNIPHQLMKKKDQKEALEVVLGDIAQKLVQSLLCLTGLCLKGTLAEK